VSGTAEIAQLLVEEKSGKFYIDQLTRERYPWKAASSANVLQITHITHPVDHQLVKPLRRSRFCVPGML